MRDTVRGDPDFHFDLAGAYSPKGDSENELKAQEEAARAATPIAEFSVYVPPITARADEDEQQKNYRDPRA